MESAIKTETARWQMERGLEACQAKNYELALNYFRYALLLNPACHAANYNTALIFYLQKKYSDGLYFAELAFNQSGQADYKMLIVYIYLNAGDESSAREKMKELLMLPDASDTLRQNYLLFLLDRWSDEGNTARLSEILKKNRRLVSMEIYYALLHRLFEKKMYRAIIEIHNALGDSFSDNSDLACLIRECRLKLAGF